MKWKEKEKQSKTGRECPGNKTAGSIVGKQQTGVSTIVNIDIRLIYTNTCYDAVGRVLIPSQANI